MLTHALDDMGAEMTDDDDSNDQKQREAPVLNHPTLRRGSLCLIYDASPDTLRLVGERQKGRSFVLVSERSDESVSALIDALGGVEFPGGRALCADEKS